MADSPTPPPPPPPPPPGMALAARCTACGTVFRVVPDQLRVSDGWVRCGRCAQVFNAAETLVDLETGAPRQLDLGLPRRPVPAEAGTSPTPPRTSPPQPTPANPPLLAPRTRKDDDPISVLVMPSDPPSGRPDLPAIPAQIESTAASASLPLVNPAADAQTLPTVENPGATAPANTAASNVGSSVGSNAVSTAAGSAVSSAVSTAESNAARSVASNAASNAASSAASSAQDSAASRSEDPAEDSAVNSAVPLPSFVRRADRAARWRQPRVRAAMGAGCALTAVLLLGQAAHAWRDQAAARWPGLRPMLHAGCQVLGCQVGPTRAIELLTVESSALSRVEQSRLYQLTVSLRNRSTLDLAMPALELSLTDAQGRLLSRRVLRAAELGASQPALGGGRDLTLQATLQTAPQSTAEGDAAVVVGYTIELFYP